MFCTNGGSYSLRTQVRTLLRTPVRRGYELLFGGVRTGVRTLLCENYRDMAVLRAVVPLALVFGILRFGGRAGAQHYPHVSESLEGVERKLQRTDRPTPTGHVEQLLLVFFSV